MRIATRLVAGMVVAVALASAAPTSNAMEKETLNFWEIVACPSENIEMLGSVRLQMQQVEGGDHSAWVFQAFWTGDAWGLNSGAQYRIRGKWMEVIQEDPPYIFLWNDHFQLIGNGTAPNYRFFNKIRVIVNAKGEPKVEFEGSETPCPTVDFDIW